MRMLIPSGEAIVEAKSCKSCGSSFAITDRDLEFYDKVSPIFAGRKEAIPTPTLCPDCRQRRRLVFRNERKLYRRKCDLTGRDIVSIYSPDKPHAVYAAPEWYGDRWDALDFGREYDASRPIAEQLHALWLDVPQKSTIDFGDNENCEYTNSLLGSKDCYMTFWADYLERVLYSHLSVRSRDCMDIFNAFYNEDSYEVSDSNDVRRSRYVLRSSDITDCLYVAGCTGCERCCLCVGLANKRYYFKNQSYPPDEYERLVAEFLSSHDARERLGIFAEYRRGFPVVATVSRQSENCVGDFFENAKDCFMCFHILHARDIRFSVAAGGELSDAYDVYGTANNGSRLYEGVTLGVGSDGVAFGLDVVGSREAYYCVACVDIRYCFLCVGLRHKSYCILNKQYTEEEYNELVPRIIAHMRETGEWGEFFSPALSPFGYNETVAMEYFPLTKDEALKQGFNWSDYEPPFPKVDKVIPASKLPERIQDIPDDILNWAIECEVTRKPYRIIKQELEFYRKHNLPIPRRHPDQRHLDRLSLRNPRKLHERTCDSCSKDIVTTYSPDRPERVYCEECYEREVYG